MTRFRQAAITGAASGMGRCFALELARPGHRLALIDIDDRGLQAVAEEARSRGAEVEAAAADITAESRVDAVFQAANDAGGLDLLVHCAAILGPGFWPEQPAEQLRRVMEVDFLGAETVLRGALPALERRSGHCVVLASTAAIRGWPGLAAYSAAKCALAGFCEAIRDDLAARGVGLTVVYPLLIDTPLLGAADLPPILRGRRIPAQRVVRAALRGAERRVKRVYVPRTVRWIAFLQGTAPGLLDWYARRFGGRPAS